LIGSPTGAQRASRRTRTLSIVTLLIAMSAVAPAAAQATGSVYVSTTGSDLNAGTAVSPWRTLQKAATSAPAGSIVYIRAGTYVGFTVTRPSLTFRPYGSELVTVNGDAAHPFVIRVSATNHVTIQGLTVQAAPNVYGAGIKVEKLASAVTITGNVIRNNRSFGVLLENTSLTTVSANTISGNETGVQVSWASNGVSITGNTIANNNRMIVNDSTPYNDRGANGVVFYKATGPISVTSNLIYGHRAASTDYGQDGGAFEIYGSSNLTISGNTLYNNLNVLETGTDGTLACSNIVFTRNVAYGGPDGGAKSQGLVLRCASSSLIANNTFSDLDDFVYYLTQNGAFSGSIGSLRIINNVASQTTTKVYSMEAGLPTTLQIDYNLSYNASGGSIAWVSGYGNTPLLSTFRTWTRFDLHGVQGSPRFSDTLFHLATGSPAIDHGTTISGVTVTFLGTAPDIGRFEQQ
jgi:parallel beta-helix repeat protein